MLLACADAVSGILGKMAVLAVKASTLDKERRAYIAELPMALFGILGLFLGVGETFVVLSIVTSLIKAGAASYPDRSQSLTTDPWRPGA